MEIIHFWFSTIHNVVLKIGLLGLAGQLTLKMIDDLSKFDFIKVVLWNMVDLKKYLIFL